MTDLAGDAFCLFPLAAWLPATANNLAQIAPVIEGIMFCANQS
jgi:hypothetical protein